MALCASCPKEVTVLRDGTLRQHQRPSSPRRFGHPPCAGSGQQPRTPDSDPQALSDAAAAVTGAARAIRDAAATTRSSRAAAELLAIADEIANQPT